MSPLLVRIWAAPASLLGLTLLPIAIATGGGCRVVRGVLEIHGGLVAWLLRTVIPIGNGASAMTLGHVILGRDPHTLEQCRDHEHVHVRQYERWGPLFIPLYLGASLCLALRGARAYRDNPFEIEAFAQTDPRRNESGEQA